MNWTGPRSTLLRLGILGLASFACTHEPAVTEPGQESSTSEKTARPVQLNNAAVSSAGVPYGPAQLWRSDGTLRSGPAPFTASLGLVQASTILLQIDSARAKNQKLMLNMTGGSHDKYK